MTLPSSPPPLQSRASGILLHPTSLPSPHGMGDLGEAAFRFVRYLNESKQRYWQILPLGPTGYGNSPYASVSAFAGNPLLIDLISIAVENDCGEILEDCPLSDSGSVDFDRVHAWKMPRLEFAAGRFLDGASVDRRNAYQSFCEENQGWLDDYALFTAVKSHFDQRSGDAPDGNSSWNVFWDRDIARRDPQAMSHWSDRCHREIEIEKVLQFHFFEQWEQLRAYAASHQIELIGDVPIFVAMDSCDVWSSPDSFLLDEELQPTVVAGVPPDYFSETGQRWGNPLYDWDSMRGDQFEWWTRRMTRAFEQVDVVRIDHFRGFESCWSIPATDLTAINGQWTPSPGDELFAAMKAVIGTAPMIAEDLGVITPEVESLRSRNGMPGMRILQFAFDVDEPRRDHFLPENYDRDTIVYTGTHDNEPSQGWFEGQTSEVQNQVYQYIGGRPENVAWDLIRIAMHSVANTAIIPMQDVLGLGNESRLNRPATLGGNWRWRMSPDYPSSSPPERLAELVDASDRAAPAPNIEHPPLAFAASSRHLPPHSSDTSL